MSVLTIEDPTEAKKVLDGMLNKGESTLVLIVMKTCPHCVAYKPKWDKLSEGKKSVNMVAVEAGAYENTALSEKNPVSQVPTVVYVDKSGAISEVENHNDMTAMKNIITTAPKNASSNVFNVTTANLSTASASPSESANPLPILPGMTSEEAAELEKMSVSKAVSQQGGNPMAAFLAAARAAAPAATLLGVYSVARSSGLGIAKRRKTRRRRGRRTNRKTKGRK